MRDLATYARLTAVLAIVATLGACDSPEERAEKHLLRGRTLVEAGEGAKARIEFRNALRLNRELTDARYELGKLAEEGGNLREAVGLYRDVADADAANLDVRIKLTQFMLLGNNLEEARRYADEAYALSPDRAEVIATKAAVDYRLGDTADAIDKARRAVEIDPDLVSAHVVLIADKVSGGDIDGALADVDAVLERIPDDQVLNLLRLRIVSAADRPDAVREQLVRMVALYPDQLEFRQALVQYHAQRGETAAAIAGLRELVGLRDDRSTAVLDLVRYVYSIQGADAARTELNDALASATDDTRRSLQLALSELEYREGNGAVARSLLDSLIAEAPGPAEAAEARLRLAGIELSEGKPAEARTLAETVLANDADNVAALAIRASVLIQDYKPEEALLDIRRALNLDPQNVQLMLLEAEAHERNGNIDLVRDRLASAARTSQYNSEISLRYAGLLRGQNQLSAAEAVLDEALRRNPADRRILAALAELRLQLGNLGGAEAIATRLREIEGGAVAADQVVAASLAQQGRIGESVAILEQSLADPDTNEGALASLVATYVRQGEIAKAETLLDDLIARNASNTRATILRAEVHLLRGQPDQARLLLQRLIDQSPNEATGYLLLSRFHIQQGDRDLAGSVMRRGVAAAPDSQPLRLQFAEYLESEGFIDDAIAQYRELYRLNPDSVIVVNNLASLLAEYYETDAEAMEFASRVVRRLNSSTVPHFQDTVGWVTFLNGDTAEALTLLRQAAEGLPNNPLVRYHLGRVLQASGDIASARAELEAALALSPEFPKAQSARDALASLPETDG